MFAAHNGHEAVVRLLIEKDGVGINTKDKNGQTPLLLVAVMGYDTIVQLLMTKGNRHINDINISTEDNCGKFVVSPLNDRADVGAKGSDITLGGLFGGNVVHSEVLVVLNIKRLVMYKTWTMASRTCKR